MQNPGFRVIIIGAGPTGLYMAKALLAADIDFIILERGPKTFLERGNHLLILPHTVRLFDQLGLFDEAKQRTYDLHSKIDMTGSGHILSHYHVWDDMEVVHSYPTMPIQRCDVLEMLYQSIPNRDALIKTGTTVTKIEETENDVTVHLADGSVQVGSVVVGADGTHGITKEYIHQSVSAAPPEADDVSAPFIPTTSHFCSIFAEADNRLHIPAGIFYETRDTGRGIQLGADKDLVRMILYKKLPQALSTRVRYTEQQMEEMAQSLYDVAAAPGVKLRDLWPDVHKHSARMVSQEEGFAAHWHTKRVVLTGDAAVTTSSVNGLGVNCGFHSTALLANELVSAVTTASGSPSAFSLNEAFARYQRRRARELKAIYDYGYSSIRQLTWDSWKDWFMDRFLKRWIGLDYLVKTYMYPMVARGHILRFLPFKDRDSKMPWRWVADNDGGKSA